MVKVLLIEDDIQLNSTIKLFLEIKGYEVISALDGIKAFDLIDITPYDLYIIDLNLPDVSGLDLVQYIRNKNLNLPIMMITASLELIDLKEAFKNGCNEYIKKPFHLDELDCRIKNILNRPTLDVVSITTDITYDLEHEELRVKNEIIKLRKKEKRLLTLLVKNINYVVSYEKIESYVWMNEIKEVYSIRQLVSQLKKHFGITNEHLIESDRGNGYKIIKVE